MAAKQQAAIVGPDASLHWFKLNLEGGVKPAHCNCGWKGPARRSHQQVEADKTAHWLDEGLLVRAP